MCRFAPRAPAKSRAALLAAWLSRLQAASFFGASPTPGNLDSSRWHAVIWQDSRITDLGALPGGPDNSWAAATNDKGQVVGWSIDSTYHYRAVLWQTGTMTLLGSLPGGGGLTSQAYSINSKGQIAGSSSTISEASRAVVWQNGATTDLGTLPGGASSYALAINDKSQVVGAAGTASSVNHAVLWQENGAITDLGTLPDGSSLASEAKGINNNGQVVGLAYVGQTYDDAQQHGVLWQPAR